MCIYSVAVPLFTLSLKKMSTINIMNLDQDEIVFFCEKNLPYYGQEVDDIAIKYNLRESFWECQLCFQKNTKIGQWICEELEDSTVTHHGKKLYKIFHKEIRLSVFYYNNTGTLPQLETCRFCEE